MNVKPPVLPTYIKNIIISFDGTERLEVIPSDKPTVPIAEAVSNRQSASFIPSIPLIIKPLAIKSDIYIKKIALALRTIESSIRLFKTTVSFFRRKTENVEKM